MEALSCPPSDLLCDLGASQVALAVKKLLPMQETEELWVRSLGGEDPLEKAVATNSSILA